MDLMPGRLGLMAFPVAFLLASIPMQCSTGENLRPRNYRSGLMYDHDLMYNLCRCFMSRLKADI